jgi:hypothetical protein
MPKSSSPVSIVVLALSLAAAIGYIALIRMGSISRVDVKFGKDGGEVIADSPGASPKPRAIHVFGPYVSSITSSRLAHIRDLVNDCAPTAYDNVHGYFSQNMGQQAEYAAFVLCVSGDGRSKAIHYDAYEILGSNLDLQNTQKELIDRPDVVLILVFHGGMSGLDFLVPTDAKVPADAQLIQ